MVYIVVIGCVAAEYLELVKWEAVTAVVVDSLAAGNDEEHPLWTEGTAIDSDSEASSMLNRKPLTRWL